MDIQKKYWTVFTAEELGDLYQEYASATDMGPVYDNNKTISYKTSGKSSILFHQGPFESTFPPKRSAYSKGHRVSKVRKSTIAGKTFYNVYITNYPGKDWYIDTEWFNNWSDYASLPDTTIASYSFDGTVKKIDEVQAKINSELKDFIYKVDDSNKLEIYTSYSSIDDFFDDDSDDSYDDNEYIAVIAIDTKIPLIKLEKATVNNKKVYKFIVDITNTDGDNFSIKSIIDSKEKFEQLLQSTKEALTLYPQFNKYADDLE